MRNALVGMTTGFLLLVVAGCGGGTTSPTATPAAAGSSVPADGASGSPTAEGSVAGPASESPSSDGGGTAVGVCALVTADELAGIFGVSSVKATVIAGPPDNCIVQSDTGDPLAAWSLTTAQASLVYDAVTSDPATVQVSGIGDKAAIVQNTGLLVLKGGSLLIISISAGADMSEDEGVEASKQIGTFAAGRL